MPRSRSQDLRPGFLRPVLQPVGLVLGHPVDRGMRVVPVPRALVVQVGGLLRQQVQRGPEVAHRVAGCCHAQPHPRLLDPLVRRLQRRSRAEEDRPRDPPRDPPLPVGGPARVDQSRGSRSTVDVGVDHRLEVVLQVLRNLRQHLVGVQRHPARHDQRRRVVAQPQCVDDRRHQAQHATRPLEPVQGGPVLVQPVEQLRMHRVRHLDPLLIGRLGDPGGKLGAVPRVEVGEHPRDRGDICLRRCSGLLEQPLPDDRERLDRRSGPPLVGDPPDNLLQPGQRLPPVHAADLDVGRSPLDLFRRRRRRRRRDRHHEHRARHRLDGLGERLRERELGVERAAGQVVPPVQLPRVRDPLVDQDQARCVLRGSDHRVRHRGWTALRPRPPRSE